MNRPQIIRLPRRKPPQGYAEAMAGGGRIVLLAGQIGMDGSGRLAPDLAAQCEQALRNIGEVLRAAGATPRHVVRLVWYVTDMNAYRRYRVPIGVAYRRTFGRHFPAMSVVGVSALVEPGALVEIEATALLREFGRQGLW